MADARVLALDLGTSSVRALVFDDRGVALPDMLARRPTRSLHKTLHMQK